MIEILKPGLWSSIQDSGRWNWRHIGVPLSGCMDQQSSKRANLFLGNHPNDPVLEVTLMGPVLKFLEPTEIAICGAEHDLKLNDESIQLNRVYKAKANDILSFESPSKGVRSYLAVAGGFMVDSFLGSCSWYKGISNQFRLEGGEVLHINKEQKSVNIQQDLDLLELDSPNLKAHPAPEFDLLSKTQKEQLTQRFSVGVNDRMGYRMNEVIPNQVTSLLSSPVLPGTVQLTPSGKIIVLMRDCQTTGGYPKVLQLTDEAINLLAQKKTGDEIKFELS